MLFQWRTCTGTICWSRLGTSRRRRSRKNWCTPSSARRRKRPTSSPSTTLTISIGLDASSDLVTRKLVLHTVCYFQCIAGVNVLVFVHLYLFLEIFQLNFIVNKPNISCHNICSFTFWSVYLYQNFLIGLDISQRLTQIFLEFYQFQ